ncbi:hypothetical protein [Parabacteroides sp. AF17-3]|uniref:hypothetical protein n=1 Tax=Parabacteroides sp. AF17-3 TaxID=2293113 RepID=UPI0011C471DC|nr:hypothetical protein [Parabacteroides sp. AF17-3]
MSRRRFMGKTGFDSETVAFINATGITSSIQKDAISNLVKSLKSNGLWTKMEALYPFCGGNDNAHKYNLKNVNSHIISWGNGATHNYNGVIPNYSINNLNLNTSSIPNVSNNVHIAMYVSNNVSDVSFDVASHMFQPYNRLLVSIGYTGMTYFDLGDAYDQRVSASISKTGLIVANQYSSIASIYRNGTRMSYKPLSVTLPQYYDMYFNATPEGDARYNSRNFRYISIGQGLTDGEQSILYNIVQEFQTSLNRAV